MRGDIATVEARATLSKFFTWMNRRDIVDGNPVAGTEAHQSIAVERTLSVDELRIVWNAADPSWQFGRIVRQLILTGGRRDQIGGLKHTELDLDNAMITLPRKQGLRARKAAALAGAELRRRRGGSKNNETFQIPLSKQSIELFRMETLSKPVYVFGVTPRTARGRVVSLAGPRAMRNFTPVIGDLITEHWSLHDLRRTFATIAVEKLDADPTVADAAINHKPAMTKGVMGVLPRAKLLEKRIELMNRWGDFIEEISKPWQTQISGWLP